MRKIYLNEESIVRNFERVFGYKNESMARRLYKYLANYKSKARITFDQYARRFFKLIYGTLSEKNRISFWMYDYNCNGSLSLLDIYDLLKYYEEGSKLHQEADILIKDISNNLVILKNIYRYLIIWFREKQEDQKIILIITTLHI